MKSGRFVGAAWLPVCHLWSLSRSIARLPSWHAGSQAGVD